MYLGDWVQVQSTDRYNGLIGKLASIEAQGFYPYGVKLEKHDLLTYFGTDELVLRLDAICKQCTRETALVCPKCGCLTCVHYSLEPELGEHRCNWDECELEKQEDRPEADDYAAILLYNEKYNDCTCWAYDALMCMAVAEGLDRDIADARYGPCDCTCHEQYKQGQAGGSR